MKLFRLFGTCISEKDKKVVMLNWHHFSVNNLVEYFIIEKSLDNKVFKIIGTENKIRGTNRNFHYLFVDENPENGTCYYRIFLKKRRPSKRIIASSNTLIIEVVQNDLPDAKPTVRREPHPFLKMEFIL